MRLGTMFRDISGSLIRKPVTQRYPFERTENPARLRGRLVWTAESCTGCGVCAMDCPSQAIEMIVLDKKAKRFILKYQMDACTFCAQCVFSCRQEALQMSASEWELAALDRAAFRLLNGDADDIQQWLASCAAAEE